MPIPEGQDPLLPFPGFAFFVAFQPASGTGFAPFEGVGEPITGGFSEVTGLEATMEPKVIKEGGRNYGAVQRAGPVAFSTVVLKRGVITSRHLWAWWSLFAGADKAANGGWAKTSRANLTISLLDGRNQVLGWELTNAMPIKFRVADLNAKGGEVAVEEIHLAHEGLSMARLP
ncbi:MAG: phage tail protein [Pseudomonadota bacterium]